MTGSRALAWVRKSKGSDDDIGLQQQREVVPQLAYEHAETVDLVDLGVQTGFSSMTRDGDGLLDDHPTVKSTLARLRDGRYDYIVAWDDRRVCRDEFLSIIKYAADDIEFVYAADVSDDELTHDLRRRIERETKEEEIAKARQAIEERQDRGYDHGRPRFGMTYDEAGQYQVPSEEFEKVEEILRLGNRDTSIPDISDEVSVPETTVWRVMDREEWYQKRGDIADHTE